MVEAGGAAEYAIGNTKLGHGLDPELKPRLGNNPSISPESRCPSATDDTPLPASEGMGIGGCA